MPASIANSSQKVRAGLSLLNLSVPLIAREHDVSAQTLYAVLRGRRPGRDKKVRAAVKQMEALAKEAFKNV